MPAQITTPDRRLLSPAVKRLVGKAALSEGKAPGYRGALVAGELRPMTPPKDYFLSFWSAAKNLSFNAEILTPLCSVQNDMNMCLVFECSFVSGHRSMGGPHGFAVLASRSVTCQIIPS